MERTLVIDGRRYDDTTDAFVIAEIGHNHQGSVEKARALFDKAKESGADAVKLQKRDNRALFTRAVYDKPYDNENSFGATYGAHREALELGWSEYCELRDYARELGVTFFATAFDFPSADFLEKLGVPAFKIASGDLRNIPLLKHVASMGKPLIVSTGGGSMDDVQRAYDAVMPLNSQLALLQCTASYPTQAEEMHLSVIRSFRERFPDVVVGLSDHYNGIVMAVAAYLLGARVVEKHFTLNHTWKGTDHALSLEPIGMAKMVRDLRRVRVAMGDATKRQLASEGSALQKMGKKLVAARPLPAGTVLAAGDVAIKSPGDGLQPYELERLIGRRLIVDVPEDGDLSLASVE